MALLQDVPEGRKLRILEVGSGAAGAAVMAALDSVLERVEFTCTASTPQLLAHARTLVVSRFPSAGFKLLDIQQDIVTQVIAAGGLPRCSIQGVLCAACLWNNLARFFGSIFQEHHHRAHETPPAGALA